MRLILPLSSMIVLLLFSYYKNILKQHSIYCIGSQIALSVILFITQFYPLINNNGLTYWGIMWSLLFNLLLILFFHFFIYDFFSKRDDKNSIENLLNFFLFSMITISSFHFMTFIPTIFILILLFIFSGHKNKSLIMIIDGIYQLQLLAVIFYCSLFYGQISDGLFFSLIMIPILVTPFLIKKIKMNYQKVIKTT